MLRDVSKMIERKKIFQNKPKNSAFPWTEVKELGLGGLLPE